MCIHTWNFPETCKINTFKHSVLTNQYLNRVYSFYDFIWVPYIQNWRMCLTWVYKTCNFYRYSKNVIFQKNSKADHLFHLKWEVRVFELQCLLTCPKGTDLNQISSISIHSVFWAQVWTLVKSQWQRQYCWMEWQRKSWTMVKLYSQFQRNQFSHFGSPATIK